jgi:hypothetical protein
MNRKAVCLIFSKSTAVLKEYNIATLKFKAQRKVQICVGTLRREKWELELQQNVFRKQSSDSSFAL